MSHISQDTVSLVNNAIGHVDQALAALRQIPKQGRQAVTVDGIEHELRELAPRLRALRDTVPRGDAGGARWSVAATTRGKHHRAAGA